MNTKRICDCVVIALLATVPASAQIIFLEDGTQQDSAYPDHHGGFNNEVAGIYSFVGGGAENDVFDFFGTVLGGAFNGAGNDDANSNTARYATVGGGEANSAGSAWSVIHGGDENTTGANIDNEIEGEFSAIAGGRTNQVTGDYSTVAGGLSNVVSGRYSTVASGQGNSASGNYSFVAGRTATDSGNNNSFVWGGEEGERTSAGADTFNVWSSGGIYLNGAVMHASDRNLKDNIQPIDPQYVLTKVNELPISTWRFKSEFHTTTHMGPMAQDFATTFNFVRDGDRHIASTDADGVALASIQGLNQQIDAKQAEIDAMLNRLESIERRLSEIEAN